MKTTKEKARNQSVCYPNSEYMQFTRRKRDVIGLKQANEIKDTMRRHGKSIALTLLLLIYTVVLPANLQSQDTKIEFEQISIEQGLSQNTVFCIFQDSRGFMWFGTQSGLNRYDGHTFKLYERDDTKPHSLSNNLVRSIFEDKSGILWIGTWGGGLNKFDRNTEEFTTFKNVPEDHTSLSDSNAMSIFEDKTGNLWIGTEIGLNKYNEKTGNFTNYKNNNNYPTDRVRAIYENRAGILWIGTDEGLLRYNQDEDNFTNYQIAPGESFHNKVRAICEDRFRVLWIGTFGGLFKFDRENKIFKSFSEFTNDANGLSNKSISIIFEDKSGILWIGTRNYGIFRFDPQKKIITRHSHIPNDSKSLSHNYVRSIGEDDSGLIWIGTDSGGLNKFDPKRKKFDLYRNIPKNQNSLSNNNVVAIHKGSSRKNKIWIGTRGGGVNRFDPENEKFTNYKIGFGVSTNPRRNDIRALHEDHFGILWVGTVRAGLYNFMPEKEIFYPYKNKYIGEEEYILSIYEDKDVVLWIGTMDRGLTRIDQNRKNSENYRYDPDNPNSLSNDKIFSILEDSSGILWVGTGGGGFNKFDKNKTFTRYQPRQGDPNSLSHSFVSAIYEDRSGMLWIGTNGGGLNKFDREKNTFNIYTTKDGLPNNVIYDILEDSNGCLWLSTNRGLSKFNPKTGEFRNYTPKDGLQGYEFNRGAACKIQSGMMFFGGINGFNTFYPDKIGYNQNIPPIVITEFKISHKPVPISKNSPLREQITEVKEITVSYRDKILSFHFAALDYTAPELNRYRYKIEGFSEGWMDLGNKHDITLTNLGPGEYTLKFKGANNHGVWNEEGTSIKIIVTPSLWGTWWFKTLLILVIGCIIWGLVKIRSRNIEKKRNKLSKTQMLLQRISQSKRPESAPKISTFSYTPKNPSAFNKIITKNSEMLSIFKYIEDIASSKLPVLITGDSGTGKDLIARAIHDVSGRKGDFIPKNIAVMDDALFSKQLFGDEKGLNIGSILKGKGWIGEAKEGTLFLDEIGDISIKSQVKLLGLIPEREFISPGTETQLPTNVRLIVATNKDLNKLMKAGQFRKDFYYRLIHKIHLPPLRERKEDIPLLVDYFLEESAKLLNKKKPNVPEELFTMLLEYNFPGNVRELAGMVYDAMNSHQSGDLSLDTFREKIRERS